MPKSARPRYSGLPILDPARLARVLAGLEAKVGSQQGAAAAVGVTPPYFWRLRHAKGGKAISRQLFNRIDRALRGDRRLGAQLLRAVASVETRPQRRAYFAWLHRQWRRIHPGGVGRPLSGNFWWRVYADWPAYAQARVSKYLTAWQRRHDDQRALVAMADVILPLLASGQTGGIERSWRELDAARIGGGTQLGKYLDAALRAQDILLDREGDVLRRSQEGRR